MRRFSTYFLAATLLAFAAGPALAAPAAGPPALLPLILQAAPLIVAPLASLLATAAEKAPGFPYEGRTRAGIVLALLVASLLVRLALGWATGTLGALDWTAEVTILLDAIKSAGLAAGGYAIARSTRPAAPGLG